MKKINKEGRRETFSDSSFAFSSGMIPSKISGKKERQREEKTGLRTPSLLSRLLRSIILQKRTIPPQRQGGKKQCRHAYNNCKDDNKYKKNTIKKIVHQSRLKTGNALI